MTPLEAKLREILGSMVRPMSMPGEHLSLDEATTSILALIEGETKAERERCARVAETTKVWHESEDTTCKECGGFCCTCELLMRPEKDYRPDEILKLEMLRAYLGKHQDFQVEFIVDDRQRVVDMWRREGFRVLQCQAWEEKK